MLTSVEGFVLEKNTMHHRKELTSPVVATNSFQALDTQDHIANTGEGLVGSSTRCEHGSMDGGGRPPDIDGYPFLEC